MLLHKRTQILQNWQHVQSRRLQDLLCTVQGWSIRKRTFFAILKYKKYKSSNLELFLWWLCYQLRWLWSDQKLYNKNLFIWSSRQPVFADKAFGSNNQKTVQCRARWREDTRYCFATVCCLIQPETNSFQISNTTEFAFKKYSGLTAPLDNVETDLNCVNVL